jgi:diadenosine tetraphosphate (Ap4A) HIT family hydrolase
MKVVDLKQTMATKQDDLVDKLSKLSVKEEHGTETSDEIDPSWLVSHPADSGCSFRCSLSFKQLTDQQLSQKYFQKLLNIIVKTNNITDFRMNLRLFRQRGLTVYISYNDANKQTGPVMGDVCISCDMDNPLSQLSLIKENSAIRVWLDAQLRNKLIVTPREHKERLLDMTDEEMTQFWHVTQAVLDEEKCNWTSMILNQGKYRNHFHLHMKINIDQNHWNQRIKKKYEKQLQQMQDLFTASKDGTRQKYFGDRKFNQWSGIKSLK